MNQTRDLPACSIVPKPPVFIYLFIKAYFTALLLVKLYSVKRSDG
jgi:hypothetical protein